VLTMIREATMKQEKVRRQPRKQSREHKTMVGNFINIPKSYLVESFVLNSDDRIISRKGEGRIPDPSFQSNSDQLSQIIRNSGRKVKETDLQTLSCYFENYVEVVNILLERLYTSPTRARNMGKKLLEYRGRAYSLLRTEKDLNYEHNDIFRERMFERLFRNALEQSGRILLADYTRRELFNAAIKFLDGSLDDIFLLLRVKSIPSVLVRKIRDSCECVKNNGSGYHHTLGVLRQLRLALDRLILESLELKIRWRGRQREKVSSLMKKDSPDLQQIKTLVKVEVHKWAHEGYPFTIPQIKNNSLDYSASTENAIGQGYWFTLDSEKENEILLHLKLPPGIDGTHNDESPYKSKALTFRFLDWFPGAASEDSEKAKQAQENMNVERAERLRFRAAQFCDMHQQLLNTIEIQHLTHRLMKTRKKNDKQKTLILEARIQELKRSRRSAPPRLLLRDGKALLQVSFLSPNGEVSSKILGEREYDRRAGVDRGIRIPVVLSVQKEQEYAELLLRVEQLLKKRECLRKHAYRLQSVSDRKKNNWERKRPGLLFPGHILKKERHKNALWAKVCRLDREIARQVASKTVWFCEEYRVKTLFFEDLRSFQAHAGSKNLSYNLSSNLWGKIIDTVKYMREALGHGKYNVWTVNPQYTSQTCHQCGERGIRVESLSSTSERKGGEYFYCAECKQHFHADVNAARNIIHVRPGPSAVSGRTA
jgi:IS605 OrfB family transposase